MDDILMLKWLLNLTIGKFAILYLLKIKSQHHVRQFMNENEDAT